MNSGEKMINEKIKSIIIWLAVILLAVVILNVGIIRDDYVVLQYLLENVDENRGAIWFRGSGKMPLSSKRIYIFGIGMEDAMEVTVSHGKVVSSRELSKVPRTWFGGSDFRIISREKWR